MTDIKKALEAMASSVPIEMRPFKSIPLPQLPPNPLIVAVEENLASEFYKRVVKWIADFDAALDQAHEVGVRLVSFGQTLVFHLDDIGYWNPSLISFRGFTDDGEPVELIQHVTQISILLTKLPRKDPSKAKRPIGFSMETEGDGIGTHPRTG